MWLDIAIIVFLISAAYRGYGSGFVRQVCSTIGFLGGLFLGTVLEPHVVDLARSTNTRAVLTVMSTLGVAIIILLASEWLGMRVKHKLVLKKINKVDNWLGTVMGAVSFLVTVWLAAAVISGLPLARVQSDIKASKIVRNLNAYLPAAPTVLADLGHLISPNGFPDVFIGGEPALGKASKLPDLGEIRPAVLADQASVVKIAGQGCGGIVEGSGFVVGNGYVATNAHVIAGIKNPYIQDINGTHQARVIWFDPNLDFAVLQTTDLAGKALPISQVAAVSNTPAAVLGYPGGGPFTVKAAVVLDNFVARGRNIYGKGAPSRSIYEVQADIIPGNSGGPLIGKDGSVIGVVFAESTAYNHVGYALTMSPISTAITQARTRNHVVGTGSCAE